MEIQQPPHLDWHLTKTCVWIDPYVRKLGESMGSLKWVFLVNRAYVSPLRGFACNGNSAITTFGLASCNDLCIDGSLGEEIRRIHGRI